MSVLNKRALELAGPALALPVGQCLGFPNPCHFAGNDLIIPYSLRYGRDAKVVHFLGKVKPWDYSYDTTSKTIKGQSQDASDMHPNYMIQWWELFCSSILPLMKEEYGDQPFFSGCTEVSSTAKNWHIDHHIGSFWPVLWLKCIISSQINI